MVATILLLLIFLLRNEFVISNGTENFSVVSTSTSPSELDHAQLEMRSVVNALKESLSNLQNIKQEIIEEIKNEIIPKTDENFRRQLTEAKNEILVKIDASEESTKLAVSKNEDLASEIQSVCQSVKEQLMETSNEIIQEIGELRESRVACSSDLKKKLNETKNYIVDEMKSVLSDNEKLMQVNMQAQLNETKAEIAGLGDFDEVKNQLAKTQQKILVEIQQCRSVPEDCREVQKRGFNTSGIYRIQPRLSLQSFLVWCDMSSYDGGWTSVVNRFDGSQNFYLNWTDYKQGFGNLSGEHWVGLDHLYELTNSKRVDLLVEMIDWDLLKVYALYDDFVVGNEAESYPLKTLGRNRGIIEDSLKYQIRAKFSTADKDHTGSCATSFEGGWWYTGCYHACLTGKHVDPRKISSMSGIKWGAFHGFAYSLKEARMMIRPR
ncbi:fibrinogen-like protein 1 isoform X2 [Zophobas morio]|uniref:fibrinogen-like protein 1 isoform X2 n=1 Tax=Zophobas morio TaxID=2755281 RepID=UPI0030833E60